MAFIILLLGLTIIPAQARQARRNTGTTGRLSLSGRIVQFNEEHRFVVINLGSSDGVEKGMVFSIFQKDEEVAKIKVNKVRRNISACDIQLVYLERGIGVGDVVIYKEPPSFLKMFKPLEPTKMVEVEPIIVDIDAPKIIILKKTLTILEEFGVIITESDSTKYTLKAHKDLELPLDAALLTDWGPSVRNQVFYNVEVTTTPRYNRLIIRLRGVYYKEGQLYDHELKKDSRTYKEAQAIAFKIKDLSEKL